MTLTFAWVTLIGCEIDRNYCIIEIDKERPIYRDSTFWRILIGFIFWVAGPFMDPSITWWQWWGMIPMMLFSFWFIFDYGLNIARKKKPLYYLNPEGSLLDQLQCKYPGPYPWFWWKMFLMYGGWIVYHYGLNAIWEGVYD